MSVGFLKKREFDERKYQNSFYDVRVDSSRVFGAAFQEAYLDNPEPSIQRIQELSEAERTGEPITEDQFNQDYAQLGLKWDPQMTKEAADIMKQRKQREIRNADIMSRGSGSLMETGGKFGAAIVANLISPSNILLSFIPVVGQGKYAALVARFGKTPARLLVGAAEGAVGAALTEPLTYAARTQEQADYTAMDSLYNILVGTAMSSGLHAATGKIGDLVTNQRGIQADLEARSIAANQMMDDMTVDVKAYVDAARADIAESRRLTRADIEVERIKHITTLDVDRALDGDLPVKRRRQQGKYFVRFEGEEGKLKNFEGQGKTIAEAKQDLVRNYEKALIEETEQILDQSPRVKLQEELDGLVDQRARRNRLRDELQEDPDLFETKKKELRNLEEEIAAFKKKKARLRKKEEPRATQREVRAQELQRDLSMLDEPEDMSLSGRIRKLRKEIQKSTVEDAKKTVMSESTPERSIMHEPQPEDTPATVRDRQKADDEVRVLQEDTAEIEEQLKAIVGEELSEADKVFLNELNEQVTNYEKIGRSLERAVDCVRSTF